MENEQQLVPVATQEDEQAQRARRRPTWMINYEVIGID